MGSEYSSTEEVHSQALIMNATFSFVSSLSLKCAVELGIPDAIHRHGRPIRLPDLTAALSVPPSKIASIARLMRLLSRAGFFTQEADGDGGEGYVLTPASRRLRERGWPHVLCMLSHHMMLPWLQLSSWFRSEESASFETTHGMSLWEYARTTPEFNDMFNLAMTQDTDLVTRLIVANCPTVFSKVRSLVDVGGGNGSIARAIAEAFPHINCTVFDLPHVVQGKQTMERVDYVGGSMFDFIPSAHALLIKRVLHDFNDEDCLKVLRKCKEVIPSKEEGGKVILVEMVLDVVKGEVPGSLETQLFYDMHMMAMVGGKQRDEKEWKSLFVQAGFTSYKITLITELLCLIEIYP